MCVMLTSDVNCLFTSCSEENNGKKLGIIHQPRFHADMHSTSQKCPFISSLTPLFDSENYLALFSSYQRAIIDCQTFSEGVNETLISRSWLLDYSPSGTPTKCKAEVIIAENDPILSQLKRANFYNHLSNYTKELYIEGQYRVLRVLLVQLQILLITDMCRANLMCINLMIFSKTCMCNLVFFDVLLK